MKVLSAGHEIAPNTVDNATKNYRAGEQDSKVSRQVGDQ